MSYNAMEAAKKYGWKSCSHNQFCVLRDIAERSGRYKDTWPSIETMAKALKLSRSTVSRGRRFLLEKGLIKIIGKITANEGYVYCMVINFPVKEWNYVDLTKEQIKFRSKIVPLSKDDHYFEYYIAKTDINKDFNYYTKKDAPSRLKNILSKWESHKPKDSTSFVRVTETHDQSKDLIKINSNNNNTYTIHLDKIHPKFDREILHLKNLNQDERSDEEILKQVHYHIERRDNKSYTLNQRMRGVLKLISQNRFRIPYGYNEHKPQQPGLGLSHDVPLRIDYSNYVGAVRDDILLKLIPKDTKTLSFPDWKCKIYDKQLSNSQ